jgi:hypothetical protein
MYVYILYIMNLTSTNVINEYKHIKVYWDTQSKNLNVDISADNEIVDWKNKPKFHTPQQSSTKFQRKAGRINKFRVKMKFLKIGTGFWPTIGFGMGASVTSDAWSSHHKMRALYGNKFRVGTKEFDIADTPKVDQIIEFFLDMDKGNLELEIDGVREFNDCCNDKELMKGTWFLTFSSRETLWSLQIVNEGAVDID